jgi:hypothetical protein
MPELAPAIVLSLIVGVFHTAVYVLVRGGTRRRLPVVFLAAVAGAYVGGRLGIRFDDLVRLGDYSLLGASVVAWLGIIVVTLLAQLVPGRGTP